MSPVLPLVVPRSTSAPRHAPCGSRTGIAHALLFAGLAAPAGAIAAGDTGQEAATAPTTLPPIAVKATVSLGGAQLPGERTAVGADPSGLATVVTRITEEDIANTNVGRDISNVFRRVPGVLANNIDQGETGNGFRMRGFATQGTHGADTAVHVDGVPQNIPSSQGGAGHGPVYLEWLGADMIQAVSVVKGPVSALFGDQNRAGAVEITTREGGAGTASSIAAGLETDGLRRSSLVLSNALGSADSLFVADVLRNEGYRHASRTERDNLFWKLSTRIDDGRYSLRLSHYRADFEAAGYLPLSDLQAGLDPRSTQSGNPGYGEARRSSLVFNRKPASGEVGWYGTAYVEELQRSRGITNGPTQHIVGADDRHILGGRVAHHLVQDGRASLFVGADVRRDRGDAWRQHHENRLPTARYVNSQSLELLTYGVFAQAQYKPTASLKLMAGLRHDRFDYDIDNRKQPEASTRWRDGVTTPKVGAAWTLSPQLEFFANAAQGFRSPAAEQICSSGPAGPLGASGGVVSAVSPSKVHSYDTGVTAMPLPDLTLSAAVYHTLNEDEIVAQPDGAFRSVGETTRRGFELETRYRMAPAASVYLSYGRILQATVNNPTPGTGGRLSVPEEQIKAGLQYRTALGPGALTVNADGYLIAGIPYYVGTPQTTERTMPLYTRYDLRGTYDWRSVQFSVHAVFQPQRFGSEIAYGSASGLLIAPVPREQYGIPARYFF